MASPPGPVASDLELRLHDALAAAQRFERRLEPFFRQRLNAVLREPSARFTEWLINLTRQDDKLGIAEEKPIPGEEEALDSVIASMGAYMRKQYAPGEFERAGNTKTHGIVRGEVIVREDIPPHLRHGVFAEPKTWQAWVRFSGPGPDSPADIDDVGFLSCAVKLMGVPGPKLLDDEQHTQDIITICTPTFVTPNIVANADLQKEILRGTPAFYFLRRGRTHLRDLVMQSWWNETQTSPLEAWYWSTTPYLLGEGQAVVYSIRTRLKSRSRIPRVPFRPPDHYLRDAMAATLARRDVEFDILVQVQTDPHRMPIEDASVRWPEHLSPWVRVATLRLPRQKFDSDAQFAFAHNLSYNPWHSLPEHRPLGNQNRARRRMYWELSRLRQEMNRTPHVEPTGDEVFD